MNLPQVRRAVLADQPVTPTLVQNSARLIKMVLTFARRYPLGGVGAVLLIVVVAMAVFAPLVAPYDPLAIKVSDQFKPPSADHWMGTDNFGRDVYSRIVYGARVSLYVGLLAVGTSLVVGIFVGSLSAYLGGKVDLLVQRIVDTMIGFPLLIFAMVIMFVLGNSINNVVIAIIVVLSPRMIRLVRSEALAVRQLEYVTAAIASGAPISRVLSRHVIPNTLTAAMVYATGALGASIVTEASLSFLGLGVPPPDPSWGQMLSGNARLYAARAPWLAIAPGLAITVVVYSFNMLGDALRDALDPRIRPT